MITSIVIGKKRKNQCGTCLGCSVEDCTTCHFCKDMKKYGGPGGLKQACIKRKCLENDENIHGKNFHNFFMKYWLCVQYIRCIFSVKGRN